MFSLSAMYCSYRDTFNLQRIYGSRNEINKIQILYQPCLQSNSLMSLLSNKLIQMILLIILQCHGS